MFKQIVIALAVVSVAIAAKEAPKEFTIGGFFEGSWVVAKKVVDMKTGNIIEEGELAQFNVTKTNDNAYDIFQLEKGTYYRKQDSKQVIMLPTSSLACEIQEFNIFLSNPLTVFPPCIRFQAVQPSSGPCWDKDARRCSALS